MTTANGPLSGGAPTPGIRVVEILDRDGEGVRFPAHRRVEFILDDGTVLIVALESNGTAVAVSGLTSLIDVQPHSDNKITIRPRA